MGEPLKDLKTRIISTITGLVGLLAAFGIVDLDADMLVEHLDAIIGGVLAIIGALGWTLHLKIGREAKNVASATALSVALARKADEAKAARAAVEIAPETLAEKQAQAQKAPGLPKQRDYPAPKARKRNK